MWTKIGVRVAWGTVSAEPSALIGQGQRDRVRWAAGRVSRAELEADWPVTREHASAGDAFRNFSLFDRFEPFFNIEHNYENCSLLLFFLSYPKN